MRKIVALTHATLDGVMQSVGGPEEDPSNGFAYGGWAAPFRDEAGGQSVRQAVSGAFDLLLGRRTYDLFADSWSDNRDHPVGKAFNKATKYVVTHRLDRLEWEPCERIGERRSSQRLPSRRPPRARPQPTCLNVQYLLRKKFITMPATVATNQVL
jgi:dihydrofolate reductase